MLGWILVLVALVAGTNPDGNRRPGPPPARKPPAVPPKRPTNPPTPPQPVPKPPTVEIASDEALIPVHAHNPAVSEQSGNVPPQDVASRAGAGGGTGSGKPPAAGTGAALIHASAEEESESSAVDDGVSAVAGGKGGNGIPPLFNPDDPMHPAFNLQRGVRGRDDAGSS